ncbi:MAG: DEAD/DEAH box helicase [Spirochaetia bacterium]
MTSSTFAELGLGTPILNAVEKCGYHTPTEVQTRAIPVVLGGHDLLATAQTGGGKTASFVLPMLHTLAGKAQHNSSSADAAPANKANGNRQAAPGPQRNARGGGVGRGRGRIAKPQALILAPTRELAIQIEESIRSYGAGSKLYTAIVYGGAPKGSQTRALAGAPDILVATPGRLLDFISEGRIDLSDVRYLVLDEGDRMMDMGFLPDITRIVKMTDSRRQTVLFSATMPSEIEKLAREIQRDPQRIECEHGQMNVETIDQSVMFVEQVDKTDLLVRLIEDRQMFRALVFTRTKHKASRIAKLLSRQRIDSDAIHGDRTQGQRKRALDAFRNGKLQVLVATDVAARGIDVDSISHVINFEMPNEAETYVHRIGRTGRAGAEGSAVSLCNREEFGSLKAIEKLIDRGIRIDTDHEWHIDIKPQRKAPNRGGGGNGAGRSNGGGYAPNRGGGGGNGAGRSNGGGGGNGAARNNGGGGYSPNRGGGGGRGGSVRGGANPRNRSGGGYRNSDNDRDGGYERSSGNTRGGGRNNATTGRRGGSARRSENRR